MGTQKKAKDFSLEPLFIAIAIFTSIGCSILSRDSRVSDDTPTNTFGIGSGRVEAGNVPLGEASEFRGNLLWPIRGGKINSKFGKRFFSFHEGMDIKGARGTPIFAAHSGKVVYSGSGFRGYGNMVAIKNRSLVTIYAHNDKNLVARNQWVEQGTLIALVGKTGKATGPHLHFETRIKRAGRGLVAIDPLLFF